MKLMLVRGGFVLLLFAVPALAQEPADRVPPPPGAETPGVEREVTPDPALERVAQEHRVALASAEATPGFQDGLREESRDMALEWAAMGRTPAVACLEVMLLEQVYGEVFVPEEATSDPLALQVLEVVARTVVETMEPLRFALARCLATIDQAPNFTALEVDFRARAEELEIVRMRALGPDVVAAHPAMRASVSTERDLSWETIKGLYFEAHGTIREADTEKRSPAWRATPLIAGSLVFIGPLGLIAGSVRSDDLDSARVRMGALGMSIGSFGGLLMSGVWFDPTADKTAGRLIISTTLTLGTIAGGLALALSGLEPRHRYLGIGMLTGSVGNIAWLIGGFTLYRRTRPFRHGRPTVTISRRDGSIGWTGSF